MRAMANLLKVTTPTPGVCPKTDANTANPANPKLSAADWARQKLNFIPSAKQAEVLNAQEKYLMLCCNRQWGKTTTMAVKALHAAIHRPGIKIVVIARSKDQAGLLIEAASDFAVTLGLPIRRLLGQRFSLKLPNLSSICAIPHTADTTLGRSAHILIVDEAAVVKDEVYFSVSPFVSRTHGSIWMLSTPSRQTGFFYEFWHADDKRFRRIKSTVADCPDIDPDFLDIQRRADPTRYKQDFECQFVPPANRLCSRELIESMIRPRRT